MAINQRDGMVTGLEGTPIMVSTNRGKIRLFSTGPATEGIQALVPADPAIPETWNRAFKRLVFNDLDEFFRNTRTFKIERNGDNRYAFFAYDAPEQGTAQIQPTVVSFVKPFHSFTNVGEGVGAFDTMVYLSQYIPNNANLWGTSRAGEDIDADFNTSSISSNFCFDFGVSSYESPFVESSFDDNYSFSKTPQPRITIAGKGKNATFISGLGLNLSNMFVELKDLTIVANPWLFTVAPTAELMFNNVKIIGSMNTGSESSLPYCRGTVEISNDNSSYTLALNNLAATKLLSSSAFSGNGFYRLIGNTYHEIAYWGDSTAQGRASSTNTDVGLIE
jgi:hypothetical protein